MPTPEPPAWTITAQVPSVEQAQPGLGAFVPGYRITFTTRDRHTGEVFVPASEYNLEHVRELIGGLASTMLAVAQLTG